MKVTLHSTSKLVELEKDGCSLPARVWEGHTEQGVPVIAFITRIAAAREDDLAEFEADLQEMSQPSFAVQAWPARMFID